MGHFHGVTHPPPLNSRPRRGGVARGVRQRPWPSVVGNPRTPDSATFSGTEHAVVTYCCVTNNPKAQCLKQLTFTVSQLLGSGSPRSWVFCLRLSHQAAVEVLAGAGSVGLPGTAENQRWEGWVPGHTGTAVSGPTPLSLEVDTRTIVTSGVRSGLVGLARRCPEIGLPPGHEDRAGGWGLWVLQTTPRHGQAA